MASINYPIGMNLGGDPSQALVHSNPSGKFTVALSSIDLGQGMKSVTRQICAETLGGPVEDVYVDSSGGIKTVVVSVGGFLGVGAKDVAVKWSDLKFSRDDKSIVIVTGWTKESLKAMPDYKYERRQPANKSGG